MWKDVYVCTHINGTVLFRHKRKKILSLVTKTEFYFISEELFENRAQGQPKLTGAQSTCVWVETKGALEIIRTKDYEI